MLEHLGHQEAADDIVAAIEKVILDGSTLTADMGGKANTRELGQAVADAL
jgi:tartrate dehydrogenase/decarboxylase/D-malate dehydrogenase